MTSFVSRFLNKGERFVASLHPNLETRKGEIRDIRSKRKKLLARWADKKYLAQHQIDVLVGAGLEEARLRRGFNPDLLIVTPEQYKTMLDIPAGIPIDPDEWNHFFTQGTTEADRQRILPPSKYEVESGSIDVVYSEKVDGMLLVESGSL